MANSIENTLIPAGLRADLMRKQMESKNTLTSIGDLYVGLGPTGETYNDGGVTKSLYQTGRLSIPSTSPDNQVLMIDTSTSLKIKWGAITGNNISDSSIESKHISEGAITNSKLGINAVQTTNIQDSAVTNNKLDGSISNDKLAGSISNDKLLNSYIKINNKSVSLGSDYGKILNDDLDQCTITIGNTVKKLGETFDTLNMGSGTITAANFYTGSDKKLKKNIVEYKYHDSILDIPVYEFDYKKTNQHTIGFIAQELQEKYPELVTKNEQGYLQIEESKLVYLLLKEVKLLKDQLIRG